MNANKQLEPVPKLMLVKQLTTTKQLLVEECLLLCSVNTLKQKVLYIKIYTPKIALLCLVILIRKRVCLSKYCIICLQ